MERGGVGRGASKDEAAPAAKGDSGTAESKAGRRGDVGHRAPRPPKAEKSQQQAEKGAAAPSRRKTSQKEDEPDRTTSKLAPEEPAKLGQALQKFTLAEMGARPKSKLTPEESVLEQALGKFTIYAEAAKGAAAPSRKKASRKEKGAQKAREAEQAECALVKEEADPQGSAVVAPNKRVASRKAKALPKEEEEAGQPGKESASARRRAPPRKGEQKAREPAEKEAGVQERPVPGDKLLPKEPGLRGNRSLRQVLQKLRLPKEERSRAAQQVNEVRDILVTAIKKKSCFPIEVMGAGSYYEGVKISSPDEFDIMLKVPGLRFGLEEPCDVDTSGAFYYVNWKRNPGKTVDKFLDDKMHLSSSAMLSHLRDTIVKEVKENTKLAEVSVERKKPGSPAVTILIGKTPPSISVDIIIALEFKCQTWCECTKNGLDISTWLGRKVKNSLSNEPLYLVPKNAKDGKCFIGNTWRLSFSHVEKDIMKNHGNSKTCCEENGQKCCRLECLKLLKYLLEQLKTKHENRNQFEKFHSYLAKTAFFHACAKWCRDEEWLVTNLDECFNRLLDYFMDCLRKAELQHFFIPKCNLLKTVEKAKCSALAKVIESEQKNMFPVFFL